MQNVVAVFRFINCDTQNTRLQNTANSTQLYRSTQKLPLRVQLNNSTETVQLMSSEVEYSRLFDITSTYTDIHMQI